MNAEMFAVNAVVEAGRQEILALMRSKGYKQKTATQSAMYETTFCKMDVPLYAIDGWHGAGKKGTSRYYGDGKTIFRLYDLRKRYEGGHVVVNMDREAYSGVDMHVEIDEQKRVIKEILQHLKEHA